MSYKYGADGLRVQKTVGSMVYNYYYSDGVLARQTLGSNYMDFLYDESGVPYSFVYGTLEDGAYVTQQYYYLKNLQGDVTGIVNRNKELLVEYNYDAWGNILSITDTSGNDIGTINPIRYRSYYYDTDTGFYYLQSRYYDPAVRRFINADGYINANGDFLGFNMFAYCSNNPVMYVDDTGENALLLKSWMSTMWCLIAADGVLPIGDIIYYGVGAVLLCTLAFSSDTVTAPSITLPNYKQKDESKKDTREKDISKVKLPVPYHVHHIVAQNDSRAEPAQIILDEVGINRFVDPANLVQLPVFYHRRLHSTAYYEYVNEVIVTEYQTGGKEGGYSALEVMRWEIYSGAIW